MFPTAAYSFIETRAVALKLTEILQLLITSIKGCLVDATPGITSLGTLNPEDCLTSRRRNTLKDLVP